MSISRRKFLAGLSAASGAAIAGTVPGAQALLPRTLYPPMNLAYFDTKIRPAAAEIRIGYAAITWGGNDRQAIDDIAAVGYKGIQLRVELHRGIWEPAKGAGLAGGALDAICGAVEWRSGCGGG